MKVIHIGRTNENNLVLPFSKVSSKHCKVSQINTNEFLLEDLNSTNGTFLNEKKVMQSLISPQDRLQIGDQEVETALLLGLFRAEIPKGMLYENLQKQQDEQKKQQEKKAQTEVDFLQLKTVYDNYLENKKRIKKAHTLKSTGLRAGLALIPFVGNALGMLSSNIGENIEEKLMDLEEEFKKNYICPSCFKFLGNEPFENLAKRKHCLYCKIKWIDA